MCVRLNGRHIRESDPVLAIQLAVGIERVGCLALLSAFVPLQVEEVETVDVFRSELVGVDGEALEHTGGLVHSSHESRTNVGKSVLRLETRVHPTVFLSKGHHVLDTKPTPGCFSCDLLHVKALSTQSFVHRLTEKDVCFTGSQRL